MSSGPGLWRLAALASAAGLLVLSALSPVHAQASVAHVWDDDFVRELKVNPQLNNAFEPGSTGRYGLRVAPAATAGGVALDVTVVPAG